jgi:hypothetical protein
MKTYVLKYLLIWLKKFFRNFKRTFSPNFENKPNIYAFFRAPYEYAMARFFYFYGMNRPRSGTH